jgi:hypothetical protein
MTPTISLIIQHRVFRRLVMEKLEIFAVKTSWSDRFCILECAEKEWRIRPKQSPAGYSQHTFRCEQPNTRTQVYSDTAALTRSLTRDYVWTRGCKHVLTYCPLNMSVNQNVSCYGLKYRLKSRWSFQSSKTWVSVFGWLVVNVPKDCSAFIFRLKQSQQSFFLGSSILKMKATLLF